MDVRSTWLFSYVNIFIAKYFFFLNFLVINALFNNEHAGWMEKAGNMYTTYSVM